MHIEVGPVSAASAWAWIAYATEMLALLRTLPEQQLPAPALDAFASLLEEWRPIARARRAVPLVERRSARARAVSPERPLSRGTRVEEEAAAGRAHLRPQAADEFHIVLVREVLDTLAHQSDADAHFVQEMRNIWDIARPS